MFKDGTDLTAGIDKNYQNGFSKNLGGPESALNVFLHLPKM